MKDRNDPHTNLDNFNNCSLIWTPEIAACMFQASISKGNCSDCADKVKITCTDVYFLFNLNYKHNQEKELLTFFATDTCSLLLPIKDLF